MSRASGLVFSVDHLADRGPLVTVELHQLFLAQRREIGWTGIERDPRMLFGLQ